MQSLTTVTVKYSNRPIHTFFIVTDSLFPEPSNDVPEQLKDILPTVEQLEMELDTAATELERQEHGRQDI